MMEQLSPVEVPQRPVRVLVVDDEPLIVEMLLMGLSYEGFDVLVARDGHEALDQARAHRPELVILDLMLPGIAGLEVCRQLRARDDMGILVLTALGDLEDRVVGLENGADDYLAKPFAFRELLARSKAILRRRGVNMARTISAGSLVMDRAARRVSRNGQNIQLTPREFDLLELLLAHPRQVFSREIILNRLWGYDYLGDTNVIDVHIRYLREKIGDDERTLIRSVRGVGYVLEPPETDD